MKYEAKNVNGIATSQIALTPWVSITQTSAITTAAAACTNCHLITEAEWMTIAQNVLSVAGNWSGGAVGSGYIYGGHNDNAPTNSLAASTDNDGYYGTGDTTGSNQKRTLTLTNGQVIWDIAGNVSEWTSATTTGGQPGILSSGFGWREWTTPTTHGTLSPDPFPSSTGIAGSSAWTITQGIGQVYSSADDTSLRGFDRGGHWYNGSHAGALTLALDVSPSYTGGTIGFRVSR
jgi:formylglycine-generating enzyme required for sulfatase activity